jgi:transposase-like protein
MHLAKKYRKRAQQDFYKAFTHENIEDVKAELMLLEKWIRPLNTSAAESLMEALPELLTLHRLKVPNDLRKSLKSTNCIESTFSAARHAGKNLRNQSALYRGKPLKKKLSERWMAATLLEAEKGFRRINGYKEIKIVKKTIKQLNAKIAEAKVSIDVQNKKAA